MRILSLTYGPVLVTIASKVKEEIRSLDKQESDFFFDLAK